MKINMCQLISPQHLSGSSVLGEFSYVTFFFLPLIMKNVFETLALFRSHGANTSLVSVWLTYFLQPAISYKIFTEGSWKSFH